VLDALNPRVRASLQQILKTGAYFVQGSTPTDLRALAAYLNPALSQTAQLAAQIAGNNYALDDLVARAAQISTALAAHTPQLQGAVTSTATTLREIAARRSALEDAVARAPGVLAQSTGVLRDAGHALRFVDPMLSELAPVAPQIARLLRVVGPAAQNAIPTIAGVQALVPGARAALRELPAVARLAIPSIRSLTAALKPALPILAGFRAYVPEVVAGFFEGFGGSEGGYYDANGHYARVAPVFTGSPTGVQGALSVLGKLTGALPQLSGYRTGVLARCPGSAVAPAAAGGNPWTAPDTVPNICNPTDSAK
jgi:phospholipid/cholesterol/gamma-HCH transport system substrate-binding protein